jgi:hypothetical protein
MNNVAWGCALAIVVGCGGSDDGVSPFDADEVPGGPTSSVTTILTSGVGGSSGDATDASQSDGDGSAESTGVRYDVGGAASEGPGAVCGEGQDCGCTAVDILFVIDNSGSMFAFQPIIGSVFADFVDIMIQSLPPGTDLHVGITTQSGFMQGSGNGNWGNACVTDASPWPAGYTPPDEQVQAGNGHQGRLFEWEGKRYYEIRTDAPPAEVAAMKDWFGNAALLQPLDGDNVEMVVSGAAYAFHPVNAEFNAGFLRDEGAVLLIFFLTDTSDISPGPGLNYDLEPYADMVRDAKSGCGGDACILTAGVIDLEHPCQEVYPALPWFLDAFGKPAAAVTDIPVGFWLPGIGPPPPTEPFEEALGTALGVAATCDAIDPEG